MKRDDIPQRSGAEICEQLAETGLVYSETDYLAFCEARDRPHSELISYFGSRAVEQMARRWDAEHSDEDDDPRIAPADDITDPKRGSAAFINRRYR